MTIKTTISALTVAALVAGSGSTAFAGTQVASAPEYKTQKGMLQTADEALNAVTQVHAARLALFENDIPKAKDELEIARSALIAAESDLSGKLMRDFSVADSSTNYLPFDMSMSLTEGFTATEENKLALQRAAGLFESAEPDDAVEVLKLAEIDVSIMTAMLPYEQTLTALDAAIGDIEDGDYFDANLDLKSINDSIITRSFSIDAVPSQGETK